MAEVREPGCTLRIAGNPADAQMRTLVEQACAADPRISALLQYVQDPTLAAEISEAELIVLPYREMHNSGTLLLSLSLSRPVLVPRTPNNVALADEVGPGWVFMYEGQLTAQVVEEGLRSARATRRQADPDLSLRDWDRVGEQHYRSYVAAIDQRRGRGRGQGQQDRAAPVGRDR
jgi:beta-1,4-mannosyltransferase